MKGKRRLQKTPVFSILFIALLIAAAWLAPTGAQILENEWPDPMANDLLPYNQVRGPFLTHGPILGRPTATSMRVWVRTSEPMPFRVVYDTKLPLTQDTKGVEDKTEADADNTGFVLDTRSERTAYDPDRVFSPEQFILGEP